MSVRFQELDLCDSFPIDVFTQRAVIGITSGTNIHYKLFHHIRNCLAHGLFSLHIINEDVAFVMEDRAKKGSSISNITARMIIKKSTLLKWIDIIKN